MNYYTLTQNLEAIWNKAVKEYQSGNRNADTFFNDSESAFLQEVGQSKQEVYDFAEDWVSSNEPDVHTFILLAFARMSYFKNEMNGQISDNVIDTKDLPPKSSSVEGVEWLPRIIPKAKAKLRGEMSTDLMFSCGGDRNFLRKNNIHAAEFLDVVRQNMENDQAIIDWVLKRRSE